MCVVYILFFDLYKWIFANVIRIQRIKKWVRSLWSAWLEQSMCGLNFDFPTSVFITNQHDDGFCGKKQFQMDYVENGNRWIPISSVVQLVWNIKHQRLAIVHLIQLNMLMLCAYWIDCANLAGGIIQVVAKISFRDFCKWFNTENRCC